MALTKRQKEFLDFLAGFLEKRGYSPSYEEIAEGLESGLARHGAQAHPGAGDEELCQARVQPEPIARMAPKYYEEQRQNRPQPACMEVPLLGRIAAGAPVEAIAGQDTLNFSDFAGDSGTYALQVRGESMIEDHICDGDYVLVERPAQARDGDIVVALVDGMETTLKRFYLEPATACGCSPPTRRCSRFSCPATRLAIQGKLLAVLRKY